MKHYVLYDDGHHKCVAFSMDHDDESVPSNQFMIIDGNDAAIIDPGGDLTFTPLTMGILKYTKMDNVRYVIGSHQDPDIIASMPRWLIHVEHANLIIPKLWERFLPHYNSAFTKGRLKQSLSERLITIPDAGGYYPLGNSGIVAIPAHFLHSVGNFQFYDPISKILFSGDMGASMVGYSGEAVSNFKAHIANMDGFHRRYMNSQKVTRLWAEAVRDLDVAQMVPQHGRRFDNNEIFHEFLDWISNLPCGVDLMEAQNYQFKHLLPE